MMATIYDIAACAGVSIATVSRVLNGNARVSSKTREKVLAASDYLNYRPNASARTLARQYSNVIAAVIPVVTNYFYMEIVRGIQDGLFESGFDLVIYASTSPEEIEGQLERAVQKGRADGLLLLSTPLSDRRASRLLTAGIPAVLIDAIHSGLDAVAVDNIEGGYLATKHLIEKGYSSIGHVSVDPEPLPARDRRIGYERALGEARMTADKKHIVASSRLPYGFVEEAGYEAMQRLLALDSPPEAVFVTSDVQSLGALQALREAGLRVPDDMALVGFDDIKLSEYVGLSTLRQPMYEMGKVAVEKLLQRIEQPDRPVSHTVFAPALVERESSTRVAKNSSSSSRIEVGGESR